jgi:hypothetical protein
MVLALVKVFDYTAVCGSRTGNLDELSKAPCLLVPCTGFPEHPPSPSSSTPSALVSVLHRSDILVKMLTVFINYGITINQK